MKRQQQLVDKAAPSFRLNLVTSGTLESESLKGKVVILHFWKYSEKPLSEPYGQVGYLEFLSSRRKPQNVEVVGIATNPALRHNDSQHAGRRTARKLMEFMNLSYPVGYDDGGLLRELGDPRDSGGELPLWVVISSSGQVVHYHSGFYEVDQRLGLKELDDIIVAQAGAKAE
jgi:peroxiredoxin